MSGVTEVEKTDPSGEAFYAFSLNSKVFWLNEDWGDSSVFDVVSEEKNAAELEQIAKHFEKFKFDPISVVFWLVMALAAVNLVREWLF